MIRFLDGQVRFTEPHGACVVTGGVGYLVAMTVGDLARVAEPGTPVQVHVHTVVKEDAIDLYGFLDPSTHAMFVRLIGVTGVGPKSALAILSGLTVDELVSAILSGDEARLTKAPGVGKKTAARILLELTDVLKKDGLAPRSKGAKPHKGTVRADLESALANLGYRPAQIDRAWSAVKSLADEGHDVSHLLREALKHV